MKCYLTGNKVCNLGIEEKRNQIFIAYNYKYKNVERVIEDIIIPALDELNII